MHLKNKLNHLLKSYKKLQVTTKRTDTKCLTFKGADNRKIKKTFNLTKSGKRKRTKENNVEKMMLEISPNVSVNSINVNELNHLSKNTDFKKNRS